MTNYTVETYTNADVIQVNQDKLGAAGQRIAGGDLSSCRDGPKPCTNIWSKKLLSYDDSQAAAAMVFLNAGGTTVDVHCDQSCWARAGFNTDAFPIYVTDLWNKSHVQLLHTPHWTASSLPPHGGFQMLQVNQAPSFNQLPHLDIPHCSNGVAVAKNFKNDRSPPPSIPANQSTYVEICWNSEGLEFHTNATDVNIFNTAKKCNDPVFSDGDVLEVFVGPVEHPTDVPSWYLELDTASSGALWGMLAHNPLNVHQGINRGGSTENMDCKSVNPAHSCMFNATHKCDSSLALAACMFQCSGKAKFVHGMTAEVKVKEGQWWTNLLKVPWGMFPTKLSKNAADGAGWKHWRLNLYRYDYGSSAPDCSLKKPHTCAQEELSAWSSSGEANFHVPQWFGSASLLDKK